MEEKKHLKFERHGKAFLILNNHKTELGTIYLHSEWKRVVWNQYSEIVMSTSCLSELIAFMQILDRDNVLL